ncbi:S-adenosylmethionine mitochondrial carrier protein-like isoform X1 [Mytilus californianus]|uniref:S-adenosylmethionine mitochondrial carrier protein-like isoform X1 n=1 Tax=Mytilus californianus TaxID=6549 RepID=UPI002246B397|nr:S-adenosylmethionine mitochondrial carrier protein-like isoform X1 [Mytilus californianus]XP_052063083.1 S-adenosylmethionine mitochondrial carrier protein-like isoform X1 [Mytilus californianus]XP_052063091.1 S-adenosylmethionine mitochondrial carrier protein-like isoform X1 [Mytilus californianus]XP_052063099.1 S-adenosylmethionine mitochondrial carrier protein-like isoform X1 [Mytilus californianus]
MTDTDFRVALLAGAAAGTSVDVSLFPLDTIKTRLQSHAGFWKSGGFRGIYSGLLSVTIGSAPTAAVFFCTYETTKNFASSVGLSKSFPIVHMAGASFGEVTCCLIRVPVEVIKQRAQVFTNTSSYSVLRNTLQSEGFRGLYRGYLSTVIREVPFSFMQFPMWEYFKILWSREQGKPVDPWQSSVCGAVAGSIASGITTPLDVAKTRIMLAEKNSALASGSIPHAIKIIFLEKGVKGLFAGIIPRVIWISIGGAIFLGVYEKVKLICNKHFTEKGYL